MGSTATGWSSVCPPPPSMAAGRPRRELDRTGVGAGVKAGNSVTRRFICSMLVASAKSRSLTS